MPKVGANGQARSSEPGDPTAAHPLELAAADLANESEPWWGLWQGMPEFIQRDLEPWKSVTVHFENRAAMDAFARLIEQTITPDTRSVWHPQADVGRLANKRYVTEGSAAVNPRWPIFIPSKGRAATPLTARALDAVGVPYTIVVQPQEAEEYGGIGLGGELLELPTGLDGLVPTRNWIWDLAAAQGHKRFWTMDDNIDGFYRLNRNLKTPVADGTFLRVIEDFVERFENVPVAGMHYFMFASRKTKLPPFHLNTRVYSNMLIDTFAADPSGRPYRNVGVYNDDTDLCLRMLKDGWCTILFNAFLAFKTTTMTLGGGMTPQYQGDGRLRMAEELRDRHPDVTQITWKWNRWQHHVDYSPFAKNELRLVPGLEVPAGVNNWGMVLQDLIDGRWVSRDESEEAAARRQAAEVVARIGGARPERGGRVVNVTEGDDL